MLDPAFNTIWENEIGIYSHRNQLAVCMLQYIHMLMLFSIATTIAKSLQNPAVLKERCMSKTVPPQVESLFVVGTQIGIPHLLHPYAPTRHM